MIHCQDEDYWINRPINDGKRDWDIGSENWIEDYAKTTDHPHRNLIIERLKKIEDRIGSISSLLEVGCNAGPNLNAIHKVFPMIKLYGIDVNLTAINYARRYVSDDTILEQSSLFKIPFREKSVDVVLSDAVFLYINREKIVKAMMEIDRVCKKALIFVEWNDESVFGSIQSYHWARDYKKLFLEFGFETIDFYKLTNDDWPTKTWSTLGHIYTAVRQ